jgi:diguanylate cyclase (GGDEF)-like protein
MTGGVDVAERRETAGLTMRLIVEYMRLHHGQDAVERMLELAGETRPLSVLEDERVWSSYDEKIALFAAAAEITGRDDIARRIGETVLDSSVGTTLKVALGLLGSPASLLRVIPRANTKFSTAGEMTALEVTSTAGVVRYRIHDGFTLSRFDCDYALGLLTQVPGLFGLPPASIEHDECQVRGAEACIYRLRWRRLSRLPWRRRKASVPELALLDRLRQLQETLADLVASDDVDDVLDAIAARAGSAVSAERFVFAARLDDDSDELRVRYEGFSGEDAHAVADQLVRGQRPNIDSNHTLVVNVSTASHTYGQLAAFASSPFIEHEQDLLEAYGRLAATALAAVNAVSAAEDRRRTAEALLGLAGQLHRAHTRADVAAAVSDAARTVVEANVAGLLLFDPDSDTLRVTGHAGFPDDLADLASQVTVRPQDTAELTDLLKNPTKPRVYHDDFPDMFLSSMLQLFGLQRVALVPVSGTNRMHGVLIAGWFRDTAMPPTDASLFAKLTGLADQTTNALEKAELVDRVQLQATTDALTGVANRRLFTEQLELAIARASSDTPPAVLFIDLDRFKLVNDTLGHAAGDELLEVVARRLLDCVRGTDLVARLGGDEFTILMPAVHDARDAMVLGDRVVEAMSQPIDVDGKTLHVRCSIGVLVCDGVTASEALRNADAAMYAAKKDGGNRCCLYDPAKFGSDSDALDLEADLYAAVTDATLHVAYQPQVDLVTGATVGVEALVRWQHPTRGLVAPDRFLPTAEATGLIVPLDLFVLREACARGAAWHRAGHPLRVAINVSARTLTDPRFVPAVAEALGATDMPAGSLEIELTEATAIADTETVRKVLDSLRTHGVTVAVDDLGTGYSSLSWVSTFPVDRIKIDRSFVADLDGGGRGEPLVEALIAMASRLGHGVIAEGVETAAQIDRLLALGCVEAQGFLLGRPTNPDDIWARLHEAVAETA